jgi:HEAT repeat protein
MLRSQQWQVARNVAEVVGEARIEEAATYLVALTRHADQRVRRAALAALAKIGTPPTVEPLRAALKEGPPELRALIASAVGRGSRGLVGLIASFAESESDVALLREYYRALGRIGTPEAVRILAGAAEAGGRLLKRKSGAMRLAAVEGLRLAGNEAATSLQSLASDGDRSVREAAQQALGAAPA